MKVKLRQQDGLPRPFPLPLGLDEEPCTSAKKLRLTEGEDNSALHSEDDGNIIVSMDFLRDLVALIGVWHACKSGADPAQNLTYAQDRAGGGLGAKPPRKIFKDHALFIIGNAHCSLKHDLKFHSFITELRIIRIKGITKLPTYTSFKSAKYELH